VTAIIGGLGAATLWAIATLASSRSSRMLGSRVVLAWVMIVGAIVGVPMVLVAGIPREIPPDAPFLLLVGGLCYSIGLGLAYRALSIGKVSIVAPIIATEGGVAALFAVVLGDPLGIAAAVLLAVIAVGVVLSSIEPARPVVPAGDIELFGDALDGPAEDTPTAPRPAADPEPNHLRESIVLSIAAAIVFGVGLVASGKAAHLVSPIMVAFTARLIGVVIVALPLIAQRRLWLTRAALPLVVISGVGEIIGSALSAWGAQTSIAVVAVLGSQFAAIAAVLAYFLFGERLSRVQTVGVVLIVVGVSLLAASGI
jgi:drug/metabolite transporter (DMT)-like permease